MTQKRIKREPDFNQFIKVLKRQGKPTYLPFYEHIADAGFIAYRTETDFDKMTMDDPDYWPIYVDFWLGMGFDCVPLEILMNCPIDLSHKAASEGSEGRVVIRTIEDFEKYPWPEEDKPIDLKYFEIVGKLLPDGVKIVGGPAGGVYEWTSWMLGVVGLSYALVDNPRLVELMFDKVGTLLINATRQLAPMDCFGAMRTGDDLGYKTGLFLPPELLRKYVFPVYKQMAAAAHNHNKPFILHSCGNLDAIYDELIDECKIDGKHSFEDVILPVSEFKKRYGQRVTPVGGLDVDFICRSDKEDIRKYARKAVEDCFSDGYWALGTGNSLPDYMPVENYIAVLEEALECTK